MTPQTFDVSARDGHRYGCTLYPAAAPDAPLLLFMPAMGTRARYYRGFGEALSAAGVSLATGDWRGIDSSSLRASRGVDFGYRQLVEDDLPSTLAALRARLPHAPLWIGGHSLGGQLGVLAAARQPEAVSGIVLIASGTVHYRAWGGASALRILAFTQAASLLGRVVGHFPGQRIGFGGREARGVIRDWAAVARDGRYRMAGSAFDYEGAMARLNLPVLGVGFAADTLAPQRATAALLAKLPQCARSHWHWDAGDTEGHALDHFSWAKQPQLVAPRVAQWMLAQA